MSRGERAALPVAIALPLMAAGGYLLLVRRPVGHVRAFDDLAQLAAALVAALSAALWARRGPREVRTPWAGIALGCAGWAAGQAYWSWQELVAGSGMPFPSVADLGFLLLPLGLGVALVRYPGGQGPLRPRDVLDGLVALCALVIFGWTTIGLADGVREGRGTAMASVVALAYPAADILLGALLLLALGRSTTRRRPLALLLAAVVALASSDMIFFYQASAGADATGTGGAAGWVAGFLLIAAAARVDAIRRPRSDAARTVRLAGPLRGMLPYLPLVLVLIGGRGQVWPGQRNDPVAETLLMVTVGFTLVRQYLMVRENDELLGKLRRRGNVLEYQTLHDTLTGLPNRSAFVEQVSAALDAHRLGDTALAVLICDLDGFKGVNDGLGHAAGDRLLIAVAARLRAAVDEDGYLARLGGDEFAVLLAPSRDGIDVPHLGAFVADRVTAAFVAPFQVDGHPVRVAGSLGLSCLAPGEPTPTVDDLLSQADIAMYTAKRTPHQSLATYRPGLTLPEGDDWALRPDLEAAIAGDQVVPYFQPIVTLPDAGLFGFETLARWEREDGEFVPPGTFLPVATRVGLMPRLTELMLRGAVGQAVTWAAGPRPPTLHMSVNVPPDYLIDPHFITVLADVLAEVDPVPGSLVIEVTEEALLVDLNAAVATIRALRSLGVGVSLDDFGSGYASLRHLHRLPLDYLKLDRDFVSTVEADPALRTMLRAITTLAQDLGITVIAEGVERQVQADLLHELGCPLAQGFLYAKAMPPRYCDAFVSGRVPWLRSRDERVSSPA